MFAKVARIKIKKHDLFGWCFMVYCPDSQYPSDLYPIRDGDRVLHSIDAVMTKTLARYGGS